MKACTTCQRLYADDADFCPLEGQKLAGIDEVAPKPDPGDPRVGGAVCGGRYQIFRVIAEGGMGGVYQALDREEKRSVALKILHEEVAQDPVALERFKREFEVSAVLPHEHVVRVHAFEHDAENNYVLVMEYLEGEELRVLMRREKVLPPERVVRFVSQVAIGLQGAHERKIVHRDLKPDNVFLCGGDEVKLLDFGSVRDNSVGAKKITAIGTTIGSPFYMSPEQAQGLPSLDHRADVWSLAAITYECLTGKVPYEGKSGPQILLSIMTRPHRPPSEVGRAHGVPRSLDAVMEEAFAKEPADRIPTVGALADRIGHAYGLEGSHVAWARMTQADLGDHIRAGLPRVLARLEEEQGTAGDLSAMDAAFAGAAVTSGQGAFPDDDAVAIPSTRPRWLFPAIVFVVLAALAIVALGAR
ncbi:serine/threonine-protein kinase [Polyangium sp. 15x6]|uniref:serine/threonine-protein kinase n=1 Tax=Polyangium sp. 15x6 TaxID=3042687 RepID=UPI00249B855C|nr:serine/threonine-protein kinase [Polyangium sp. 15x6]MDI3291043.1 serine/threonine-protein kinase [Polyangium sp. 15x6]